MKIKFLLLLGVSGVGKSSLMHHLLELDKRFTYISPYITRKLRLGESDKVSVSNEEMDKLIIEGKILVVNNIYGIRYATPKDPIESAFAAQMFPLLDWPIGRLSVMQDHFPDRLFTVYLEPPSIAELERRLGNDSRDANGKRLLEAITELQLLGKGCFDDQCDLRLILDGELGKTASLVYRAFMSSMNT